MSELAIRARPGALRFSVRVRARASRSEIVGVRAGVLRIRVQAPPVDGAANEALISLLADELGVAQRRARIVSGATSLVKTIEVDGLEQLALRRLTNPST